MSKLTGTPTFQDNIRQLETTDPRHPDTWNPNYQQLINNDVYLRRAIDSVGATTQEISGRVSELEDTSSVGVQRAVTLDWLYRDNRISFELWSKGFTLIDAVDSPIMQAVSGDDSVDVESTDQLRVGEYYILSDAAGTLLIQCAAILSGNRIRTTDNLSRGFTSGVLTRCTLDRQGASIAIGVPGDMWLSTQINIGENIHGGAVIVRRSLNAGDSRLYFRDQSHPEWTEQKWSLRRQGGDIPSGFADYEYILPMKGGGSLRIDIDGEPIVIRHIVAIAAPTGLGGYFNPQMRPTPPVNRRPANSATDTGERPTLAADGFSSPTGNKIKSTRFQLSISPVFTGVLHDSGDIEGTSYAMPKGILLTGTTYYMRASCKDVSGLASDWSAVSSFTTRSTFAYVNSPVIISPAQGQQDTPEELTLQTIEFSSVGDDTHTASQWQIKLSTGSWATPLYDSGEVSDLTLHSVPAGVLSAEKTQYSIRVRHKGAALGFSEWSQDSSFVTKDMFAQVLGIVLALTGGGAGTWQRINEKFEPITTNAATFANHPVYAAIIDQVIDGQSMVKLPKFYSKQGLVPSGQYAGKQYWMVSDKNAPGFSVDPAFLDYNAEIEQFWVGKYQGTDDGAKLGSSVGVRPLVSIDLPSMLSRAVARNTAGVSGFMLWSIYQLAAIQKLALIEIGGADSQAFVGQGNVSSSASMNTDHATVVQASWRGIIGLWGNVRQVVDGLQTDASRKIRVWDNKGLRVYQDGGFIAPQAGWTVTISTSTGDDFDMGSVFVPGTTDSADGNGSFAARANTQANSVMHHGGCYSDGSAAGLFSNFYYAASYSSPQNGARLAKV